MRDDEMMGNASTCNSGACCLTCGRYVNGALIRKSRGELVPGSCPWCARMPPKPPLEV